MNTDFRSDMLAALDALVAGYRRDEKSSFAFYRVMSEKHGSESQKARDAMAEFAGYRATLDDALAFRQSLAQQAAGESDAPCA